MSKHCPGCFTHPVRPTIGCPGCGHEDLERQLAEAQAEIVQLKRLQLTSQDAAVVVGLRAERDALRAKLVQAREEAEAGKDLAGWAAAIKWNHRERNTEEWLAGLRERIEKVQALTVLAGTDPHA